MSAAGRIEAPRERLDHDGTEPGSRAGARILVVDDVPMFRELEQLFLARIGHVRTAASAEEALTEAMAFGPEVIVLDIHLPDRAGDEIADELRQAAGAGCAIVFVTSGRAAEHQRAIEAGAADVLCKPLSRGTLIESVARFIGRTTAPAGLPRVPHIAPVKLRGEGHELAGTIRNLSRGGLFIEAQAREWTPVEGSDVSLDFDLPGVRGSLKTTARVVWRKLDPNRREPGIGVRFVALDGSTARELDDFVHERAPSVLWLSGDPGPQH